MLRFFGVPLRTCTLPAVRGWQPINLLAAHMAAQQRTPLSVVTNNVHQCLSPSAARQPTTKLYAVAPGTADLSGTADAHTHNLELHVGAIELIVGPMFAGKTTRLLQRVAQAEAQGHRVLLVKSCKDNRYSQAEVVSHTGQRRACLAVPQLRDLQHTEEFANADVIAIDEAQFLSDAAWFAQWAADRHCKRVIMAGLDGDYKRRKFGQMLDLVPCADTIEKLSAHCQYCQADGRYRRAVFTLRKVADDRQEVVGGADMYAPVCRRCYLSLSQLAEFSGADSETSAMGHDEEDEEVQNA